MIIGPSGAGKTTLAETYIEQNPRWHLVRTYTTRPRRRPDESGHTFVTPAEADKLRTDGSLIGDTEYHGYWYGLPQIPLDTNQAIVLLRAMFVVPFLDVHPTAHIIQLEASLDTLMSRLKRRGEDDRMNPAALSHEIDSGRSMSKTVISTEGEIGTVYKDFTAIMDSYGRSRN